MAYVVTDKCLGERYGHCAEGCPVDAFRAGTYKGEVFMVIDPDVCIACGACKSVCPIDSIVESEDQSPEWAAINKELAGQFKEDPKSVKRPGNEPPRKPGHTLR